jgi:hypothetical protein
VRSSRLLFTDLNKSAVRCAIRNAQSMGVAPVEGRTGNMFEPIRKHEAFDLIIFAAPFFPSIRNATVAPADRAGGKGSEFAEQFVQQVSPFLLESGHAITYLPEYVRPDPVQRAAQSAGLCCEIVEKFILYPFVPKFRFPLCHEIQYRSEIERATGHVFRDETWGGRQFLSFKMRYFVLSRTRPA